MGGIAMPLIMARQGEERLIRKIGGKAELKKHLENLGFVVGGTVTVISEIGGNVIVNVKNSRIAISREMACRILV
jgi:ferrous iron transport protein A